jgi:RimJ/RimL family protein N-acetyltransferase
MTDLSPLYALRLRTPRLELRLGSHDELVTLGRLAEEGIHPPEEMPFAIAWSDQIGEPDFMDGFLAFHESELADWRPEKWSLNLLVWTVNELVGMQGVGAEAFAERRTVETGSWLGSRYQRRGLGTEMRAAVLELAFRGLGAEAAESGALAGNAASWRVSEKLGYRMIGTHTVSPRGEPVESRDLRVTRSAWTPPLEVEIEGLEPCLPLFGLGRG